MQRLDVFLRADVCTISTQSDGWAYRRNVRVWCYDSDFRGGGRNMKKSLAAFAFAILLLPVNAHAQERLGDAALGAVSGLIFGPVGAIAGGVVGYTAGPSIANAWGIRRSQRVRQTRPARYPARASRAATQQDTPMPPGSAGSRSGAPAQAATAQVAPQQVAPQPQAASPPPARALEPASAPSAAAVPVQSFE
jgi:hypothetical protein